MVGNELEMKLVLCSGIIWWDARDCLTMLRHESEPCRYTRTLTFVYTPVQNSFAPNPASLVAEETRSGSPPGFCGVPSQRS